MDESAYTQKAFTNTDINLFGSHNNFIKFIISMKMLFQEHFKNLCIQENVKKIRNFISIIKI